VIAVDIPYVSEAAPTLKQLDTLLCDSGVEHAIFLGASFSGLLVQAYALLYPGRTRALILSHTGAIDPARAPNERAYATRTARLPAGLIRGMLRLVVRLLTRRTNERSFWVRGYDEALAPLTRESMVSRYSLAASIEELPTQPAWPGDVLVIRSDNDAIAKPADQERLRLINPKVRWHQFTGAGHRSYSKDPVADAAAVTRVRRARTGAMTHAEPRTGNCKLQTANC
jgi:pimeloyl-ACP methyl ester carboxylesterase